MERADDFAQRRRHLAKLSDEELKVRFWQLARQVVTPVIDLARTHTSPSIERSVLLRMGFNSLESKGIVDYCVTCGCLGKGAGQAVLKLAELRKMPYLEAGRRLAVGDGWEELKGVWK